MVQTAYENRERREPENFDFEAVASHNKKRKYADAFPDKEDSPLPQTIVKRHKLNTDDDSIERQ